MHYVCTFIFSAISFITYNQQTFNKIDLQAQKYKYIHTIFESFKISKQN